MLLRDYAGVYTMHLAAGTLSPYWRIVIVRSSVTAQAVAPALLLLGAIALLEAGVVGRGTVFLAAGATFGSGVLTAWRAVVPLMAYYPRYPISTLIAALDPYSQAGFYLVFFSALLAVKKGPRDTDDRALVAAVTVEPSRQQRLDADQRGAADVASRQHHYRRGLPARS